MFNRYSYVGNDPVNKTDPFGLCDTSRACTSSAGIATGTGGTGSQQFGRPKSSSSGNSNSPSDSGDSSSSISSGENLVAGPEPSSVIVNPLVAAYLCPGKPGVCTVTYPRSFFQHVKEGPHGLSGHTRRSNLERSTKGLFDMKHLTDDQIAHMAEMTLRLGSARWAPGFNLFGRKVNITAIVPNPFGTEMRNGVITEVFGLTMRVEPVKYRVWAADSLFPSRVRIP